MAHFIHKSQVPTGVRRPHIKRYRNQLRKALLDPSLSESQRFHIKKGLDKLGQKTDGIGAVDSSPGVPTTVEEYPGRPSLIRLLKQDLLAVGQGEGASVKRSMTKAKIVDAIQANRTALGWA